MVNSLSNGAMLNAIHPDLKLDPDTKAGKVVKINEPFSKQLVVTRSGEFVKVPVMMGSTIKVKALDDGTYAVTTKPSKMGSKAKTVVLTEAQLIEQFGNKKSTFHTVG